MTVDIGDVKFTEGPIGTRVTEFADVTTAKTEAFLAQTALDIGKGKALAELEGKANIFEQTTAEGATPNDSLNLTAISAARRQGRISAEEARVRVNKAVRQAVSNNPLFADEIREDAKKFFQATTGSTGIFTATSAEALATSAAKKRQSGAIQLELDAQRVGMTVPQFIGIQQQLLSGQQATALLNTVQYTSNVNMEGASNIVSQARSIEQLDIMGLLRKGIASEGGISPQDEGILRNRVQDYVSTQLAQISIMDGVSNEDKTKLATDVKTWGTDLVGFIESSDKESIIASLSNIQDNMGNVASWNFFRHERIIQKTLGDEGSKWFLQSVGSEKNLSALRAANPAYFDLLVRANQAGDYIADHVNKLNGLPTTHDIPEPAYKSWLSGTLSNSSTPEEVKDKIADELNARTEAGDPEAMSSYLSDATRSWVMSSGENKNKFKTGFEFMKNSVRLQAIQSDIPIEVYELVESPTGELRFRVNPEKFREVFGEPVARADDPRIRGRVSPVPNQEFIDNMELVAQIAKKYPSVVREGQTTPEFMTSVLGEFSKFIQEEEVERKRGGRPFIGREEVIVMERDESGKFIRVIK